MNDSDHVRRVGVVCCHCVRNAAYYRAGRIRQESWGSDDFWRNANSNFLDIAVLEWCKLFADKKGRHHWKTVMNPDTFMVGLLTSIGLTQIDFDSYIQKCKLYRDKFLAHLDEDLVMHIPDLTSAIGSATYLHNLLVQQYSDILGDAPCDLAKFYSRRHEYAVPKYPDGT